VRAFVEEYKLSNGHRIIVLAKAGSSIWRPPKAIRPAVMDMSFANQALSAEYLVKKQGQARTRRPPAAQGSRSGIASLKLRALGMSIDTLTSEQIEYMTSWKQVLIGARILRVNECGHPRPLVSRILRVNCSAGIRARIERATRTGQ